MWLLIDMAEFAERNTSVKMLKTYQNIQNWEIEISRVWGLIAETVPVGIGALGLGLGPGKIRRKRSWKHLQKISLATGHSPYFTKSALH